MSTEESTKLEQTIAEKLAVLRALVEGKRTVCPSCKGARAYDHKTHIETRGCTFCFEGYIPNPTFVPMLNVVRVECHHRQEDNQDVAVYWVFDDADWRRYGDDRPISCNCQGTGYVARSWDGLPKGALEGALASVAWNLVEPLEDDPTWAETYAYITTTIGRDNSATLALDAVIEAMQEAT